MKLFLYHHCPFCIRPRLVADLKSLNIPIHIFANDDEQAHYDLVGKKIVPILQKDDGSYMTES